MTAHTALLALSVLIGLSLVSLGMATLFAVGAL